MSDVSQIIQPFFAQGTHYKPSKKSATAITKHFFEKDDTYSHSHKKLILKNLSFLVQQGQKNCGLPKNQEEFEEFIKNIQANISPMSLSLQFPKGNKANPVVKAMYQKIMMGEFDSKALMKCSVLKAFFVKNPTLLLEMRQFFQSVLIKIGKQAPGLKPDEIPAVESLIGNILSFIVYFDPQDGETIQIPQFVQNSWQMVDYTVERIALTPKFMGSPMVAFGLKPANPQAKPLLIFKGTTYPADDGFALSLLSDLNIGAAVGGYAFMLGRKKLEDWLKKNTMTTKASVFGQSLGGALTLQTVSSLPQYIDRADAFSPTKLFSCNFHEWKKLAKGSTPKVNAFYPRNDLVPLAGFKWRKEWNVYRIFSSKKYDPLYAHTQIYFSHKKFMLVKVDPQKDQNKPSSYFVAITHMILSVPLFLIGAQFYIAYLLAMKVKDCFMKLCKH